MKRFNERPRGSSRCLARAIVLFVVFTLGFAMLDATMSELPFEAYAELVRKSGLVAADRLDEVVAELAVAAGGKPSDSRMLSRRLIKSDLLTDWQHQLLRRGHTRGFFLGTYRLLRVLGSGGMGTVYLAEHQMMRRLVAIKVISDKKMDAQTLARFERECQCMGALDHPNIVRAFDFNRHGKYFYLVMEYVQGVDLEALVARDGVLKPRVAAEYLRQAADAIHYAHSAGIIHRDIKPANLLLDGSASIKLLDLGLARVSGGQSAAITSAGEDMMLGTVDYVSPEQAVDCHAADARSDIYSLGCTLYYLIAGQPPFNTGAPMQRLMAHQTLIPKDLSELRPDTPQALSAICRRMCAKNPDERFSTAAEVRDALGAWLGSEMRGGSALDLEETKHEAVTPTQTITVVRADTKTHAGKAGINPLGKLDSFLLEQLMRREKLLPAESSALVRWWRAEQETGEDLFAFLQRFDFLPSSARRVLESVAKGYFAANQGGVFLDAQSLSRLRQRLADFAATTV